MYIPSLEGGGAERVFVNLANYFVAQGVEVILISSGKGIYGEELSADVNFLEIKIRKFAFAVKRANFLLDFLNSTYELIGILKREKPDVLFSTLALGNIKSYIVKNFFIRNLKFVSRQANVLNTASKNKILNYLLRKAFLCSDVIIANSYDTKDSILELVKKTDVEMDNRVSVIGNPVFNVDILKRGDVDVDFSFLKYGDYILNVGRLTKEKDHFSLLRSYKLLLEKVKIDLVILGVGPLEKEVVSLINELGLADSVHILGFCKNPYPYYKNAKVFALTSVTEGFGNVLVESLSFGIPIVSTNCKGGPTFILENGTYGKLVKVGDIVAFSESLTEIIKTPNREPQLLINRAKEFSLENIGEIYLKEFQKLRCIKDSYFEN